ncbi:anti-repressor SinI family protein [Peribacillus sp. SI8-4]|nr:anti-repressor SinI family protein [Peribacillus sp. SI8-4]
MMMKASNDWEEWVSLMEEARNAGLTIEDVRVFIVENGTRDKPYMMV